MRGLSLSLAAVCLFGLHASSVVRRGGLQPGTLQSGACPPKAGRYENRQRVLQQPVKVELFSGRALAALALQAGGAKANLCDLRRPRYCLALEPRAKASCFRAGAVVRCSSPNASREFQGLSAYSMSLFRVTPESGKAQATSPVMLSKLEIRPSRSGLRVVVLTDLESYAVGVLAGEATILRSSAAREAMAIRGISIVAPNLTFCCGVVLKQRVSDAISVV